MNINITTDRLSVRPIEPDDAPFILQLLNSEGWLEFIGDREVSDVAQAENYIQKILDNGNYHYHVITRKQSENPIGIVTFLKRENERYPDLGYALLPGFSGVGYAFEASHAYLEALKSLGEHEVVLAITKLHNQRSVRLLDKLGFAVTEEYGWDIGNEVSYYAIKLG